MPSPSARATYFAYRAGSAVAQAMPRVVAEPLAGAIGRVAVLAMPGRRRMVERHQRRATGLDPASGADVRRQTRGAFESYARYWLELFRLIGDVRKGVVADHFVAEGYDHIEASVARGSGTILALPHLGGWEYAAAWMTTKGHRVVAVVEQIEPPELFEWFARVRDEIGIDVVPLGPDVSRRVIAALQANAVVALLCDRDLSGDGVPVDFFGEPTTLPAGPALLALRTGASVVPVGVYFEPEGGHRAVIRPPLAVERRGRLREDVARITQDLAGELAMLIAAAPEQWHLLQPNWPSDRSGPA